VSFFGKKAEPEPPKGGGLAVLRARARGHVHLPQTHPEALLPQAHAWLKEALGMSGASLDAFLAGGPLPAPKIALLIDYLGMKSVVYDEARDLLVSTAPEPEVLGKVRPAPYVHPADAAPMPTMQLYPRDPNAERKPAQLPRPGWAS
jgi:hypothetical protein